MSGENLPARLREPQMRARSTCAGDETTRNATDCDDGRIQTYDCSGDES